MDIELLHCEGSDVKHTKYSEPWNNTSHARAEDDAPTISDNRQSLIDSTTLHQLPVSEFLDSGTPCLVGGNASRDTFLQAPLGSIGFLHRTELEPEPSVFNPWNVADSEQTAIRESPSYVWHNHQSSDQAANWDFQSFGPESLQNNPLDMYRLTTVWKLVGDQQS